jgi:DNA primase
LYKYDKDELKLNLSIEQVFDLVAELGGEPRMESGFFISKTICHNHAGEGSYKLYYYDNTKLFRCYTDCGTSFDIYELVRKIKNNSKDLKSYYNKEGKVCYREWELFDAVEFVAIYYGYSPKTFDFQKTQEKLKDWEVLNNYEQINKDEQEQRVELRIFDNKILQYLPRPRIITWEQEGIKKEVMDHRGIAYDPKNQGIVIPHYDINNQLVGIRERTLIKEEENFGKYRPAILNGVMYNHPLGFNLYNLNNSKDNIKIIKKVIVYEGEKSCLLYASYFGEENDISVACCGSSLITYQVKLLLSLGVKEIIVAFK